MANSMALKRWKLGLVGGVLAMTTTTGCKHQLFLEPSDHKTALLSGLEHLERQPHAPIAPSDLPRGTAPATVLDPNRPPRNMTLKECIAIAVEKGNVGSQGGALNAGFANDGLAQFQGRSVGGSDTVRALVLDPAIVGADIERALSKFDARWITSLTWGKTDQPTINFQQQFQNGDTFTLNSTLAKPLPTGGVAGITFQTDYRKFAVTNTTLGAQVNPAYTPRVQFLFEQPLLQSFGIEINQLSNQHPGSLLVPGLRPSGGQTTEGILITRLRYDQQKAAFDQQLNQLLLNVETAYWNLYAAYYNLYAQEEILKESYYLVNILRQRLAAGTVRRQELTQTLQQYWQLRAAVLQARQQVLTSERNLRGLMGENSFSDSMRIVPIDEPTTAGYVPDFYENANEALASRPELLIARHDLKFRQLDLLLQKNQRRPDLRAFASYDIAGLGTQLDGSETFLVNGQSVASNAFASFANNEFNSYQFGVRLDIPLGFRDANAAVRQSQINMIRSYYALQDWERKAMEGVVQQIRDITFNHESIQYNREARLYSQETLSLNRKLIEGGAWDVNTLFNVLQVQRDTATNVAREFQSIASYNISLAALEFAKGTIQRYNNVTVGDGPLPEHVQKRAADHFSARNAALKLREQPADLPLPPLAKGWESPTNEMLNPTLNLPNGGVQIPGVPYNVPAAPSIPSAPSAPPAATPSAKPMAPATPSLSTTTPWTTNSSTMISPWPSTGTTVPVSNSAPVIETGTATFSSVGTVQIPSQRSTITPVNPKRPSVLPVSRDK